MLQEFELNMNTTVFSYRENFVDTFMGYYIAEKLHLNISRGFLSNDTHYAIISYGSLQQPPHPHCAPVALVLSLVLMHDIFDPHIACVPL